MEYDDSRDTATRLCDLKLNMQEEEESCCWIFPLSLPDIWGKNKQGGGGKTGVARGRGWGCPANTQELSRGARLVQIYMCYSCTLEVVYIFVCGKHTFY